MKDQILKFLKEENITATKLATDIGVQRSSISHILSGRNKPSYDLIYKILEKYPYLNAEWLVMGKGNMYKDNRQTEEEKKDLNDINLFTRQEKSDIQNSTNSKEYQINKEKTEKENSNVEKIVIFYSNNTFKEYYPE